MNDNIRRRWSGSGSSGLDSIGRCILILEDPNVSEVSCFFVEIESIA